MRSLRLCVLVSGRGSNLRAIASTAERDELPITITKVVADRRRCPALEWARERDVATEVVRPRDYEDLQEWDRTLTAAVQSAEPDLVVLAGFMRIVRTEFLKGFGGRTINVHPALLPSFPGLQAPHQALAAGVRVSGCTVHLVDAGVDTGPILAQATVSVFPDDTPESLQARIQKAEHRLLPAVIGQIAHGRLSLGPPIRWSDPKNEPDPRFYPAIVRNAPSGE